MKLRASLAALGLTYLCASTSATESADEINGIFGYKFGEIITTRSEGINHCLDNKIICWGVNRDITPIKYNVRISVNKDKKIFQLTAFQPFYDPGGLEACLSTASRLAKTSTHQYKLDIEWHEDQIGLSPRFYWAGTNIRNPNVEFSVSCKKNSIAGLTETNYLLEVSSWNNKYVDF